MAGPSPAFLAQLNAGLGADPFAAGAAQYGLVPQPQPQPNADAMLMGGGASTGGPPIVVPGVQPAPAPPPAGPPPPQGAQPVAMPGADQGRPQQEEPQGGGVEWAPVTRPGRPAAEVPTRGPKASSLLQQSFQPGQEAADSIALRSGIEAAHQKDEYEVLAEKYLEQEAAMQRVATKRADELQQIRADYTNTIQSVSKQKLDTNRWWANQSTLDKIGTTILLLLGGAGGGLDRAQKMVDERIERDIQLQKFDYEKGLNLAQGQMNAYAMMLQQYGSEDAALHASRAAAQQAVAMKIGALGAQWKGTETANQADQLRAHYQDQALKSEASGYAYLQPTGGSTEYQLRVRGRVAPGTFSAQRAQEKFFEHDTKPAERTDDALTKGGIDATLQQQKLKAEGAQKSDEGAKFIAGQLQSAGVPQARAAAEQALAAINKSPGGKLEAVGRKIGGITPLGDTLPNAVAGDDANAREQAYWGFANAAMKAMMGNVTEAEFSRAQKQLGSASDPESRKRAIAATIQTLDEIEKSIKAGATPQSQAEFDARREKATGGRAAAPPGAKQGW